MTEKQFQAILSPIYRFEALLEDTVNTLTGIEMLTVDVKSLQRETVDQLNQQTALLGEIRTTIRDQVNVASASSSPVVDSLDILSSDIKSLQRETVDQLNQQTALLGEIRTTIRDQVNVASTSSSPVVTSVDALSLDLKSFHNEHMDEMRHQSTLLKLVVGALVRANRDRRSSGDSGSKDKDMDKAARFKPFSVKDTGLAAFMMVSLSAAIVASAGIFSLIPNVSGSQLLTAVAVAGTVALMADGFVKMLNAFEKLKGTSSVSYEGITASKVDTSAIFASAGAALLSMIGMVAAIAVSSWIMQLIMPVAPIKLLTAVLMGVTMLALAPTFVKIADALGKMKSDTKVDAGALGSASATNFSGIWTLMGATLLSMIGISAAIAMSSWIFQLIVPVKADKLVTAFLIGIALTGAAWAYSMILKHIGGKGLKEVALAAAAIPLIAIGIRMAAWILSDMTTITDPMVYATVFLIGIAMLGAAYSFSLIMNAVKGAKEKELMYAGAAMVIIAGAIWATAWVFTQLPDSGEMKAPNWRWSLETGLALLVFSVSFIALVRGVKGASLKDMGKAAAAAVFVALGIVGTAFIFDIYESLGGKYGAPPEAGWTLNTGLALIVFGVSISILAVLVKSLGVKTFVMGVLGAIIVSVGVLAVAWILSFLPPNFTELPIGWSIKIALGIVLFSIPVGILGAVMTSGVGAAAIILGVVGMIIIAAGIWVVATIFSKLPDISGVAKMLTDAMLAPVNGIVDVLARLKNEIGVDNLLPLAGGIIAISVSLLALAGATAGVAAGGLFSSIANVGKAFFDGVAKLFGGEKAKGPLDILSDIVNMAPEIAKVAKPIKILGEAFMFLQGGQNMEVLNRFFELMQLDPKASNIKAVQEMAPPIRDMVTALANLDTEAPSRLKELFGNVNWSSIFTPVASVASSMTILAVNANLAGSGVIKVATGIEMMVASLNSLKKDYIDAVIRLFNEVDWRLLVDPIDAISTSIHRMSVNAVDMGTGMKMTAAALVTMSALSSESLQDITKVFEALALSNLTEQGTAMLLNIAPAMASISATMLVMRSDAYVRMFEVMTSSSEAIVAMAKPMSTVASAMDQMGRVNVDGIEWAHKMARQLARSSFNSQATALEKMAKSYSDISKSSNTMDVEAINATTDMFKALAYLYQNGRKNAMEELGEKLTEAIQELARMIADFEGTVNEQAEGSKTVGQAMAQAIDRFSSSAGSSNNSSGGSTQAMPPESLQELIDLFTTGNAYITIRDVEDIAAAKMG